MSLTAFESFESRNVQNTPSSKRIEKNFIIKADPGDVTDENAVHTFLVSGGVVDIFEGLPLTGVEVTTRVNSEFYKARVTYEVTFQVVQRENETEPRTEQFNTIGGQVHVSYGLRVIDEVGEGSEALGAAINYDGETIGGLDITAPAYSFSLTVKKLNSEVTDAYQRILHELTGKVNDANVKFFLVRGLKFLGARGSIIRDLALDEVGNTTEPLWEITYEFAGRRAEFDIPVGEFNVPLKLGWDYIDVVYRDKDDPESKSMIRVPKSVRVLQIFEEDDFNKLGIDLE